MRKIITIFSFLFLIALSMPGSSKADQYNAILEYCTGTWCQWCPCGHEIIDNILMNYPNTVVLAYHGAGSDPWLSYSLPAVQAFGFVSYPSGVVGRKTGIQQRDAWNNHVVLQTLLTTPGVSINVSSKNYTASTRTLSATIDVSALADLTGDYYICYVITEDNLIYSQTGNGSCAGNSTYIHDHVVKSLANGQAGELIHSGAWSTGQQVTRTLNYVLPDAPQIANPENCHLNIFVYKQGTSISTDYDVQQSMRTSVSGTTGISGNTSVIPEAYSLSQNYPNPFNPTTSFNFSIPKSENVSVRLYDMLGNEIETYVDGFINAGTYNVQVDGSKLSSGIYFYKLTTAGFTETKRMNLIK